MKKKYLLLTFTIIYCSFFKSFGQYNFGDITTGTPRPNYVGAPLEEMKSTSAYIRERNQRENNKKMQSAVQEFLNYEESAYKELAKDKLTKEDYEGFLFYHDKLTEVFVDKITKYAFSENIPCPYYNDLLKKANDLSYPEAYCYFALSNFDMAKKILNVIKKDNYEAVKLLDLISKIEDASVYYESGDKKEESGDLPGAIADYNKAIEIWPNSTAYYNRGLKKARFKDTSGAIQDWKKAIELTPDFSMAYNNIAYAYLSEKNLDLALTNANKAIEIDNSNGTAYDTRGEIKFSLSDFSGCISDCTTAIGLSSNSAVANSYFVRGRAKFKSKDKSGACTDWEAAKNLGKEKAGEFLKTYCK